MRWKVLLVGGLVLLVGCGIDAAREAAHLQTGDAASGAFPAADASGEAAPALAAAAAQVPRKIIYEADVHLIVKDFSATEQAVERLVEDHGGYLSDVSVDRHSGEQRTGRWQARIPVDRFDAFVNAIVQLGVPTRRRQTAQDVTEEFVDLEARITNAKRLEERILELLNKSTGEIKDVIEVERELARVRGEVEQMEGRLNYLTNRTELTTVTITAREERDYVPPQAPTLAGRASTAWSNSLVALKDFAANLLVGLIYAGPWVGVLAVVVTPTALLARLIHRRRRRKS